MSEGNTGSAPGPAVTLCEKCWWPVDNCKCGVAPSVCEICHLSARYCECSASKAIPTIATSPQRVVARPPKRPSPWLLWAGVGLALAGIAYEWSNARWFIVAAVMLALAVPAANHMPRAVPLLAIFGCSSAIAGIIWIGSERSLHHDAGTAPNSAVWANIPPGGYCEFDGWTVYNAPGTENTPCDPGTGPTHAPCLTPFCEAYTGDGAVIDPVTGGGDGTVTNSAANTWLEGNYEARPPGSSLGP